MRLKNNLRGACVVEYVLLLTISVLSIAACGHFFSAGGGLQHAAARFAELGGGSGGTGVVDSGACDFSKEGVWCSETKNTASDSD